MPAHDAHARAPCRDDAVRQHVSQADDMHAEPLPHQTWRSANTPYRTPTQLRLLERFSQTLETEEI